MNYIFSCKNVMKLPSYFYNILIMLPIYKTYFIKEWIFISLLFLYTFHNKLLSRIKNDHSYNAHDLNISKESSEWNWTDSILWNDVPTEQLKRLFRDLTNITRNFMKSRRLSGLKKIKRVRKRRENRGHRGKRSK